MLSSKGQHVMPMRCALAGLYAVLSTCVMNNARSMDAAQLCNRTAELASITAISDTKFTTAIARTQLKNGTAELCVSIEGHVWRLPYESLGATRITRLLDTCYGDLDFRGPSSKFCHSDDFDLTSGMLGATVRGLTDESESSSETMQNHLSGFVSAWGGRDVLVLQIDFQPKPLCLVLSALMDDMTLNASFRTKCFVSSATWATSRVPQLLSSLRSGSASLGSEQDGGAFALTLIRSPTGALEINTPSFISPNYDQQYLTAWLTAVARASNSESAVDIKSHNDPLPELNAHSPFGRASRWIVAGMLRIISTTLPAVAGGDLGMFSLRLRDWMAAQELSGKQELSNTLLRGELARVQKP